VAPTHPKVCDVSTRPTIRCAIYTRKSTEEGLEQEFNTLDAQREACASYIASQRSEGWVELPDHFDDGGFSGGTLERPALQNMMRMIEASEIDVVVVYKIDRLTRSLLDFTKLVDQLDRRSVTFVSVTQSFNTTTSMGRLTLNVLLSFAQFEREVTGERIRDKFAASKKKGIWMGGYPPLGYDISERKLIVNVAEADTVNIIFRRYIELGCVRALQQDLDTLGIRSKRWTTATGKVFGGQKFGRGALYCLLRNRTYLGETSHKGAVYPGEHSLIVSKEVFLAAGERLASTRRRALGKQSNPQSAMLAGLLFDSRGCLMTPTYTRNRGKNYAYYVSQNRQGPEKCISRVGAPAIDELVRNTLTRLGLPAAYSVSAELTSARTYLCRVELHQDSTKICIDRIRALQWWRENHSALIGATEGELICLNSASLANGEKLCEELKHLVVTLPVRAQFRGGRTGIIPPSEMIPVRPRCDPVLMRALAKAHRWKASIMRGEIRSVDGLAKQLNKERRYVSNILRLAFLSPTLTKAILEGRQPPSLRLAHLLNSSFPLSWSAQEAVLKGLRPNGLPPSQVIPAPLSKLPANG
jgi:site-specific DNA recombinase